MVISWYAGQAVGAVAARTIDIQIEDYKKANPLPKLSPHDLVSEEEQEDTTEPTVDVVVDEGNGEPAVAGVGAGALETAQPSVET